MPFWSSLAGIHCFAGRSLSEVERHETQSRPLTRIAKADVTSAAALTALTAATPEAWGARVEPAVPPAQKLEFRIGRRAGPSLRLSSGRRRARTTAPGTVC